MTNTNTTCGNCGHPPSSHYDRSGKCGYSNPAVNRGKTCDCKAYRPVTPAPAVDEAKCVECGHERTDHDYMPAKGPYGYPCGLEYCQCTDYSERVDAVNMSPECVDETAKREQSK